MILLALRVENDTAALKAFDRASTGIALPVATNISCAFLTRKENGIIQTRECSRDELVTCNNGH